MKRNYITKVLVFIIISSIILLFLFNNDLVLRMNINLMQSENLQQVSVVSDAEVIPDKYNTGTKGELELIDGESWRDPVSRMNFAYRNTGIYTVNMYYTTFDNEVTIENKEFGTLIEFSGGISLEEERHKKITFKNCKFTSVHTDKLAGEYEFIFENCTFKSFYGSGAKFYNCKFTKSTGDTTVPFQEVEYYNCFFYDFVLSDNGSHIDGVQTFGDESGIIRDIKFYNCRFEMPVLKVTGATSYVNACLMLQNEFNDMTDVIFDKCILNGGGMMIYINPSKGYTITNLSITNTKAGDCYVWGVLNGNSTISRDEYADYNIIYDVSNTEDLYVGSVWEENNQIHISVTNDTSEEKVLTVKNSRGETYTFDIPACYVNSQLKEYDAFEYDDFPFDIDITVPYSNWVQCYDGDTLIRTQVLSTSVEEEENINTTINTTANTITNATVDTTINTIVNETLNTSVNTNMNLNIPTNTTVNAITNSIVNTNTNKNISISTDKNTNTDISTNTKENMNTNTISNKITVLPYTGRKSLAIILTVFIGIIVASYFTIKKYEYIK